jgi:hypothetical protein
MDRVINKHGRIYVTTTLYVKGGRRWQASSTIGVIKNY